MKSVNLNLPLVNLEGKAVEDVTQGKIVATQLANANTGDAIKFWLWATTLYQNIKLTLDDSDFSTLNDFVKNCANLTNAAKAQILKSLSETKEIKTGE